MEVVSEKEKVSWWWRTAHESASVCRIARDALAADVAMGAAQRPGRDNTGNPLVRIVGADKVAYFKYHCLPDSFDPESPARVFGEQVVRGPQDDQEPAVGAAAVLYEHLAKMSLCGSR